MSAADTARSEATLWSEIHRLALRLQTAATEPGPCESEVTGNDAGRDLARRADRWGYRLPDNGLPELGRFAAALAISEAEAWEQEDAIVATQAFEDRRFLFADRIVHWAVPWADVVGRCHPDVRSEGDRLRDLLLGLGERLRPAPLLTGSEGLYPPGEDSFGPVAFDADAGGWLTSLHCGTILFEVTIWSLTGTDAGWPLSPRQLEDPALRADLVSLFENARARWMRMASENPGTERLWRDLAERAGMSASRLESRHRATVEADG